MAFFRRDPLPFPHRLDPPTESHSFNHILSHDSLLHRTAHPICVGLLDSRDAHPYSVSRLSRNGDKVPTGHHSEASDNATEARDDRQRPPATTPIAQGVPCLH